MKRKLCVLKPETDYNTGDRVFWYDHSDTEDKEFNETWVRIYNSDNIEIPFLRCHVCKIKEVDDFMIEPRWGGIYLKDEYSQFKSK